jgi:hypothetical protein
MLTDVEKKQRRAARDAKRYLVNKDKIGDRVRQWSLANPDKRKATQLRFLKAHPGYHSTWNKAHPETANARHPEWVKANPDKVRTIRLKFNKAHPERVVASQLKWNEANRDKIRIGTRRWKIANPGKVLAYSALRRARKLQATPKWLTKEQIKEMELFYINRPEGYHVDHVYPLRGEEGCGLHVPWNLQYLSANENLKKGNRVK